MNNYSFIQKFLHHLVLGNRFLNRSLYEFEKLFFKSKKNFINNKHVFITGLPRSGTTVLLNFLYNSGKFASLTFSDMPFTMAPNFYNVIKKKNNKNTFQRLHDDRIVYSIESPEALDEIFFKVFKDNKENISNLKYFVGFVLNRYEKERYLSKNNKNYNRINFIKTTFPNSTFLITYRSPLDHAFSLLTQHKKFCILQRKDKFILDYMNYLGHNEFGLGYKFWNKPKDYNNPNILNHWLEQWTLFYDKILQNFDKQNSYLVNYEDLCNDNNYVEKLKEKLDINFSRSKNFFQISTKKNHEIYDKKLLEKCNDVANKLNLYAKI